MIGLVLSGGFSLRAGKDKGLYRREGNLQCLRAESLLKSIVSNTFISIREEQKGEYLNYFPADKVILDASFYEGPLRGIMSAFSCYPKEDLFVTATDLPEMNPEPLKLLYDTYRNEKDFDFYGFHEDGRIEPFPGIYTEKLLVKIQNHTEKKAGPVFFIKSGNPKLLEIPEKFRTCFTNYNEKELYL